MPKKNNSITDNTQPDELVKRATERLAKKKKEEEKSEEQKNEELRQGYLKRTGRKEMKP